jgi:hypothetical protein
MTVPPGDRGRLAAIRGLTLVLDVDDHGPGGQMQRAVWHVVPGS